MIDRATVDKIMDAVNIVDVVGEFVNLRKSGVNYKGLCPFHDDKTPSFMVSPARQICKCFSCGEGGNAVNFLMKHEQITYPEALRWLAKKYNIDIQERELTDDEKREQSERESMFVVNEWACQYFHEILLNDVDGQAIGKQYFRSRGIRDDIINKFQLGFALTKRDALCNEAKRKGYKDEFLIKTGLAIQNERGIYDRFAGRAIFPWMNVSGKVVAFGGRKLDAATKGVQQKYVNSPDSELYHKERELYGIYQAKKAIVKEDCVYMVEGYTDVIAMHQCGLENVVANSGTALSIHQIKLLRRFTQNIVLLYDGDEAGIHAAMRGTDMLLAEAMNVKVLLLPDGDDPDSFSRKHTAQEFKEYIDSHQTDFIQFKTDLLLKGVSDPIKKAEAINNIIRSIAVIPDPMVRTAYIKDCSQRLDVDERTLISQTNKYIAGEREEAEKRIAREQEREQEAPQPTADLSMTGLTPKDKEVERLLVKNIIRHGNEVIFSGMETEDGQFIDLNVAQYIDYDLGSDGLTFSDDRYNRILQEAVAHSADPGFESERYFMQHPDPQISQLAASIGIESHQLSRNFALNEGEAQLRQRITHLILDFRMDIVSQQLKVLQRQLKEAGSDMQRIKELMTAYQDAQTLRNELARRLGSDVIVS
ncbi:DNA primase [Prevotella sp. tc2-28]|uniref:DNA primase n=1 Tax=Prevotella sp. tc2-28 TaxID=1761888 RepID=UPI000896ACCF|nr:DNA primase [Prevotella sp. tc2-28]SEA69483.1 DNA primase [Prevotella sp. tc2-28]